MKSSQKRHPLMKALVAMGVIVGALLYRMPTKRRKKLFDRISLTGKAGFHTVVEYCIPHERNGFQPKLLRHRSVHTMLLIVVVVKVAVLSILFALYPNLGFLNQDVRAGMYDLINQYRSEKGTPNLVVNAELEQAALAKGQDMLENNYFSHFGLDGKKPWQWLDPNTYAFKAMGENLAMDFLTANSVFRAFQKSPAHDRNLVNPAYTEIGIAVLNGSLEGHDTNVMVVFFASPKASRALAATTPAQPAAQPVAQPITIPVPKPVATPQQEPKPVTQPTPLPTTTTTPTSSVAELTPFELRQLLSSTDAEVLGESTGNEQVVFTANMQEQVVRAKGSTFQRVIAWSDRFFAGFLIAAVLLLIINIIVKIRIQHAPIIANGLMLIAVVAIALYANIHRAEAIGEQVIILAQTYLR